MSDCQDTARLQLETNPSLISTVIPATGAVLVDGVLNRPLSPSGLGAPSHLTYVQMNQPKVERAYRPPATARVHPHQHNPSAAAALEPLPQTTGAQGVYLIGSFSGLDWYGSDYNDCPVDLNGLLITYSQHY